MDPTGQARITPKLHEHTGWTLQRFPTGTVGQAQRGHSQTAATCVHAGTRTEPCDVDALWKDAESVTGDTATVSPSDFLL